MTATSEHGWIEREAVVDRYVTGRLSADEVARFEEHYLECAACCAAVEDAERLQRALAMTPSPAAGAPRWWSDRWMPLALAASLLVALGAGLVALRLDRQLDAARGPRVASSVAVLSVVRGGADDGPIHRLQLPAEPGPLRLFVPADDPDVDRYDLEWVDAAGVTVWRAEGVEPSDLGGILVELHSSELVPGRYVLRLVPAGRGGGTQFALDVEAE